MDDWDADDVDVTAGLKSKVVDLGLENVLKKDEHPAPTSAATASSTSNERSAHLEAMEAEKQSDLEAGMMLLGLAPDVKQKKFENLSSKKQFEDYGNEVGETYKARSKDPNYMAFALPVVTHLCSNMTKLQLEEIQQIVQGYINVFTQKEAEAKKVEQQKKEQKQKKNKKKQLEKDDMVVDEYADYEDEYY